MMKVEWINVIIFVLKRMDAYTALRLLEYFYPKTEQHVSPETLTERWGVLEQAANEVGINDMYCIQKKGTSSVQQSGRRKSAFRRRNVRGSCRNVTKIKRRRKGYVDI